MKPSTAVLVSQIRLEQKSFWRNRQAAAFSFLMPLLLLVMFAAIFDGDVAPGLDFRRYFVAGMLGVSIMSATYTNLAITLSFHRDLLILKRLRGTPLSTSALFAAKAASSVVLVVIQTILVLVVGRLFYDVAFPANWLAFVFFVVLGVVVFVSVGIAFTVFIPNADSAPAMVQMPFLVLQFASGVFFSYHETPAVLRWIANVFPLRWLLEGLRAGYLGLDFVHVTKAPDPDGAGSVFIPDTVSGFGAITSQWLGILIMLAWFAASGWVALRHFRWEKRTG